MCKDFNIVVVMNDIYICEDVEFLICSEVLMFDCIMGVEIGGCLYIVICEDVFMNLVVVVELN